MMEKQLIASLWLKNGKALSPEDGLSVLSEDPVSHAVHLSDLGADALIVKDLSSPSDDREREQAVDCLRRICAECDSPVIADSVVRKMEDAKKLLYAGCKQVIMRLDGEAQSLTECVQLFQELSAKFGKEKMILGYTSPETVEKLDAGVKEACGALLLTGAKTLQEVRARMVKELPLIVELPECTFEDAVEILGARHLTAVCGAYVDRNIERLQESKQTLAEIGIDTTILKPQYKWADFKTNGQGLLPCVVQDYRTDEVLMVAYMNEEAYTQTIRTGRMTYYSREREKLWVKGEESGHFQYVKQLTADCDLDTLLAKVKQIGAACHTGNRSCFFNEVAKRPFQEKNPVKVLESVYAVIEDRKANPREGSYTNYLFDKGIDKILKKLGEEATEITIAAKNPDVNELHYEIADYLYHLMVLMSERGITWDEITETLARR